MRLAAPEVEEAQLGLAPLLDVVLLLLIFFLVTTSFTAPRIGLELPQATTGAVAPASPLVVEIDARGGIHLDGNAVEADALGGRLAQEREADPGVELVLRAAAAVEHGRVVEVLDVARSRGITHVGIEVAPSTGGTLQ